MLSRLSARLLAVAGALLLLGGGAALWLSADRSKAVASTQVPPTAAPAAELAPEPAGDLPMPEPGRAKSKEERRFARVDRNDDGRITQAEFLHLRRRNFDKLDTNGDGKLSFEEYAAAGIVKFNKADSNRDGQLLAAEFATTAPKPRKTQTAAAGNCRCPAVSANASDAGSAED
jgi:hypothetical protein